MQDVLKNDSFKLEAKPEGVEAQPKEIQTLCKDCVFAKFHEDGFQNGCSLGRLERFQKNQRLSFLDDKTYRIKGICNTFRNSEWAVKKLPGAAEEQDAINLVMKEVETPVSFIVFFKKENTLDQLDKFVESCENQIIKPKEIHIINEAKDPNISDFLHEMELDITWKLLKSKENSEASLIDESFRLMRYSTYFSIFYLPFSVPKNFIESFNISLNYRLDRFLILRPAGSQGLSLQSILYKWLNGNKKFRLDEETEKTDFFEKIKYILETSMEDYKEFIKNVVDICPQME